MLEALRDVEIPETLLRQFIPSYLRMAEPSSSAEDLLLMSVDLVLASYDAACGTQPS
jgi:D-tagatose-1,6-bisphosphate aldolase subunit GatZ/KbaZ